MVRAVVLGRSTGRAAMAAALLTFCLAAVVSEIRPTAPEIHDEFAYLLASDTFSAGRLTNAAHPMRRYFASPQVLQEPTYQAKYPPGPGLVMALGQVLTGRPLVGVWLAMAMGAAALCWALAGWISPGWALVGALLPALRFGYFAWDARLSWGYWSASYWGGAVAMAGGALVLGGTGRLVRGEGGAAALPFGLGLAVLALSRPYEGGLVGLVASGYIAVHVFRRGGIRPVLVTGLIAGCLAGGAGIFLAAYNEAVTGDPLQAPHALYSDRYQSVGHFVFSPLKTPSEAPGGRLGRYHAEFSQARLEVRSGWGIPLFALFLLVGFFVGPVLLPFLVLGVIRGTVSGGLFCAATIGAVLLGHLPTTTSNLHPHYFAPAAAATALAVVLGLRSVRAWAPSGRPVGVALVRGVPVAVLATFLTSIGLRGGVFEREQGRFPLARLDAARTLTEYPGDDLVIVRYSAAYANSAEWVYNAADVDAAPIVWAHDLGEDGNAELLDYYPARRVWILEPDYAPPRMTLVREPLAR